MESRRRTNAFNSEPLTSPTKIASWLRNPELNPFSPWTMPNYDAKPVDDEIKTVAEIGQSVLLQYRLMLDENTQLEEKISALNVKLAEVEDGNREKAEELTRAATFWKTRYEDAQKNFVQAETSAHLLKSELEEANALIERFRNRTSPQIGRSSPASVESVIKALEDELARRKENEWVIERKFFKSQGRVDELEKLLARKEEASCSLEEMTKVKDEAKRLQAENERQTSVIKTLYEEIDECRKQAEESEDLVSLVTELSGANKRLSEELEEAKYFLTEAQDELHSLRNTYTESIEITRSPVVDDVFGTPGQVPSVFGELESAIKASISKGQRVSREKLREDSPGSPTKRKDFIRRLASSSRLSSDQESVHQPHQLISEPMDLSTVSQLKSLTNLLTHTLQRIMSTNTLALNRRLSKSFDLPSLSQLSNTILDHIYNDISGFPDKFSGNEVSFNGLVLICVSLLKEVVSLRKRLNDVETAFYTKMENISRAEVERVRQKRELEVAKRTELRRSNTTGAWMRTRPWGLSKSESNLLPPGGSHRSDVVSVDDRDRNSCKLQ